MRAATMLAALVFLSGIAGGADGFSTVIHVPGEQPTIQAGLAAALDGDTVLVADGTYTGPDNKNLTFDEKAIILISENGPENCVIDCQRTGRGVYYVGLGIGVVIEGFTFTKTDFSTHGGGIYCTGAVTIRTCRFVDTDVGQNGGGIYAAGAATISDCLFTDSEAERGGGIYAYSNSLITGCTFSGNTADYGGAIHCFESAATITNCLVTSNGAISGGGIYTSEGAVTITNCLIYGNTATDDGGGIRCDVGRITNCTVGSNTATSGGGVFIRSVISEIRNSILWNNGPDQIYGYYFVPKITYSVVQGGHPGEGNLVANPQVVAGPDGNYYLSQTAAGQLTDSPCIDAGGSLAVDISLPIAEGESRLNEWSTRTDQVDDTGTVDIGYHYSGLNPIAANLSCVPAYGALPFASQFTATLVNDDTLRPGTAVGARIDVDLAGGASFSNWKSGHRNMSPGETYDVSWNQNIPALGSVLGDTIFTLVARDITPSPYNQPPYPPDGDTDQSARYLLGMTEGPPPPVSPCETAKLMAGDAHDGQRFGISVSVDGNRAVIGAYSDDGAASGAGAAYVYHYDGTSWSEEVKLTASDAAENDQFGISAAISGDCCIVGAYGDDDYGSMSGSAYVFRLSGTQWTEEAKLTAADAQASGYFGKAVTIDGDCALIGAYGEDDYGHNSGAAYVFRFDGSSWTEEARLSGSEPTSYFGDAVDLDGDCAVIGSRFTVAAYIFRHSGSTWSEEARLTPSNFADLNFGDGVAVSGNHVIVGASGLLSEGNRNGAAYVYKRRGATWYEQARLAIGDGYPYQHFGESVSLCGDYALIGSSEPAVYLYRRSGLEWIQDAVLLPPGDPGYFGYDVSLGPEWGFVGAHTDDEAASDAGAAHVYDVTVDCTE